MSDMAKIPTRLRDRAWRHDGDLLVAAALIALLALAGLAPR
jgi:hypothetical protein